MTKAQPDAPSLPGCTLAQRHRAVRVVAGNARDADDLTLLLEMLGLRPQEGSEPPDAGEPEPQRPQQRPGGERDRGLTIETLSTMLAAAGYDMPGRPASV